jgi:hypothetical protein
MKPYMQGSVTKLILLQAIEFSGEQARQKDCEIGHKNYFWPFGHFRIQGQKRPNVYLQSHFSVSKIGRIVLIFFH